MRGSFFCFGLGYSAGLLARRLLAEGWTVAGTTRGEEHCAALRAEGIGAVPFERGRPIDPSLLDGVTHVLSSVPPDKDGDPVLDAHFDDIAARRPGWIGYLSTTGVYGDYAGNWVDEAEPLRPSHDRAWRRVEAEQRWFDLNRLHGLAVHVFRLAGIYGPGRSILNDVRDGSVQRIVKKKQYFGRIHVEDIATVLRASMERPQARAAIYNVTDDLPVPPHHVAQYACELLGVEPPPPIPFKEAEPKMSPMQRSFWTDSKRVRNDKIKTELGVVLKYPDYKAGLKAVLEAEEGKD